MSLRATSRSREARLCLTRAEKALKTMRKALAQDQPGGDRTLPGACGRERRAR